MAQIIIDIPDAALTKVRDAFASAYSYDVNKIGTETKAAFAKRMVANFVKEIVRAEDAKALHAAVVVPAPPDIT